MFDSYQFYKFYAYILMHWALPSMLVNNNNSNNNKVRNKNAKVVIYIVQLSSDDGLIMIK